MVGAMVGAMEQWSRMRWVGAGAAAFTFCVESSMPPVGWLCCV
jgi:hypothetical protein